MELKLRYEKGKVVPELTLTPSETESFRVAEVDPHVSWSQMMMGLDETNNPRYTRSSNRCDAYRPMRQLTTEEIRQATVRILGDIRGLLAANMEPPIEVRMVGDTPAPIEGFAHSFEAVFPEFIGDPTRVAVVRLQMGEQVYELNPVPVDEDTDISDIRTITEGRLNMLRTSFQRTLEAYQREYNSKYDRLREQIAANVIVPPSLSLDKVTRYVLKFFARHDTGEGGGRRRSRAGQSLYWFQLPFLLRQTKIRIDNSLKRLKPEYRIITDGIFTIAYSPNGQEAIRNLSLDPMMLEPMYHNHSLGGFTFCSGSYSRPVLDLAGDVVDQVVHYRNEMQNLLEVCNPSSWGTNRHGLAVTLRTDYGNDRNSVCMTDEEAIAEDTTIAEGGAEALDSQSGRGLSDVWRLTSEEMQHLRDGRS